MSNLQSHKWASIYKHQTSLIMPHADPLPKVTALSCIVCTWNDSIQRKVQQICTHLLKYLDKLTKSFLLPYLQITIVAWFSQAEAIPNGSNDGRLID